MSTKVLSSLHCFSSNRFECGVKLRPERCAGVGWSGKLEKANIWLFANQCPGQRSAGRSALLAAEDKVHILTFEEACRFDVRTDSSRLRSSSGEVANFHNPTR